MQRFKLALIALPLLAGGCSMLPYYSEVKAIAHQGVETAIQDRQNFNDLKTEALLAIPCAASLGSVFRLTDTRKQAILIEFCGGPEADSQMTVKDLGALLQTLGQTP